ncbi:MAG: phosphoribosylformylglycinamidine synthase subunit PurQ [Oligoflexia bacterium]|nr:phosphoribosylformylglycinamidine synthase subunit PurQ [Oligoflexia bacterium]
MRVSVILFPGSNCDHDAEYVYRKLLGQEVQLVWHREHDLRSPDLVVLPGGFAYGDYLRTGALARVSPVMQEIRKFASRGGPVLGICNGFQILCESGLLPGALLQNIGMRFLSQFVHIKIENAGTVFTRGCAQGSVITCPVAHFEGNYFADEQTLERLEGEGRVVFRYCDRDGRVDAADRVLNPNGAAHAIAGIANEFGNVVGLMPHPERAVEDIIGGVGRNSGLPMFAGSLSN